MSTRQLRQSYISNFPYRRSLVDLVVFSQFLCISPFVEVSLGKKVGIPTPLYSPNSEVYLAVKKSTITEFYSLPSGGFSCIVGGNDVDLKTTSPYTRRLFRKKKKSQRLGRIFPVPTGVILAYRDECLTTPNYLRTYGG